MKKSDKAADEVVAEPATESATKTPSAPQSATIRVRFPKEMLAQVESFLDRLHKHMPNSIAVHPGISQSEAAAIEESVAKGGNPAGAAIAVDEDGHSFVLKGDPV